MQSGTILIGIGNPCRCDDGVGLAAIGQLRNRVPPGVRAIEAGGDGAALMEAWKGADSVILVDAVQTGAPPGTIHRLDASAAPVPSRLFHSSTHAFSLPEAIELARALNQLPSRVIIYGIEGADFSTGERLSIKVEQSIQALILQIMDEPGIAAHRAPVLCNEGPAN